jgi:hypothetical protein
MNPFQSLRDYEEYVYTLKQQFHSIQKSTLIIIEDYGYELWCNNAKLAWHDSQPHLRDLGLASSFPHHKHIPPDIKHHRIPAPNMSFTKPNPSALIQGIENRLEAENNPTVIV